MFGRTRAYVTILAAVAAASPAAADSGREKAVERGEAHYLLWCANCHGVNADGKGPLVELLKVVPSDLTRLHESGSEQPVAQRVLNAVAGRHEVPTGEKKMPVFSENLEVTTVIEIADYLDTVQR